MTQHTVMLELPFPAPEREALVAAMREAILAHVPTGEKLTKMIDKRAIGPDLGSDFQPCYRMEVTFETEEIEPLVWSGD